MTEPRYCPQCRAPWVWGNDFCVQCGHVLRDWLRIPARSSSMVAMPSGLKIKRSVQEARPHMRLTRFLEKSVPVSPVNQGVRIN